MLYLSFTSIDTYQQCPLKYKFNYIDKLGKLYRQERSYFSFGESLHNTLASFFQIQDLSRRNFDVLEKIFNKEWKKVGYISPEEEYSAKQQALFLLRKFFETEKMDAMPLGIEEHFQIQLENFLITGKVDRIDPIEGKRVEIIDYKTTKYIPKEFDEESLIQLLIYGWGISKKTGWEVVKLTNYYLLGPQKLSYECSPTDIENTEKNLLEIAKRIQQDKEFLPKENKMCLKCDFLTICPLMGIGGKIQEKAQLKESYDQTRIQLETTLQKLNLLNKNFQEISSTLDANVVNQRAATAYLNMTNSSNVEIFAVDYNGQLKSVYAINSDGKFEKIINDLEGKNISDFKENFFELKKITISDSPFKDFLKEHIKNLIIIPIIANERLRQVVFLANKKYGEDYLRSDLTFIQNLSTQHAIAYYNAILFERAITDGLTKLFTRRYFELRLDNEINRAKRYNHRLSLIMLDIDFFKNINDTYGHLIGDNVLIKIAEIIKSNIRQTDIPARYGGEEFAIVLIETDKSIGLNVAEKIRKKVEEYTFVFKDKEEKITISGGVAEYENNITKEELIERADKSLYNSKITGRNKIISF